jgi:hypothetical protein
MAEVLTGLPIHDDLQVPSIIQVDCRDLDISGKRPSANQQHRGCKPSQSKK